MQRGNVQFKFPTLRGLVTPSNLDLSCLLCSQVFALFSLIIVRCTLIVLRLFLYDYVIYLFKNASVRHTLAVFIAKLPSFASNAARLQAA